MSHDRESRPIARSNRALRLGDCSLESHVGCLREECEVRQAGDVCEQLTAGQIKIGIVTAVSGIIVSTLFAVGVLAVWVFHAWHGREMPAIPLLVASIAGAPFAAGVITTLKIPKKARVKLEQK